VGEECRSVDDDEFRETATELDRLDEAGKQLGPNLFILQHELGLAILKFRPAGVVEGKASEGDLDPDEFGPGGISGVPGLVQVVGVDQAWPIIVVAGKDRLKERVFVSK
jgi:hypothetical protein